jgi:hypothetical protein
MRRSPSASKSAPALTSSKGAACSLSDAVAAFSSMRRNSFCQYTHLSASTWPHVKQRTGMIIAFCTNNVLNALRRACKRCLSDVPVVRTPVGRCSDYETTSPNNALHKSPSRSYTGG